MSWSPVTLKLPVGFHSPRHSAWPRLLLISHTCNHSPHQGHLLPSSATVFELQVQRHDLPVDKLIYLCYSACKTLCQLASISDNKPCLVLSVCLWPSLSTWQTNQPFVPDPTVLPGVKGPDLAHAGPARMPLLASINKECYWLLKCVALEVLPVLGKNHTLKLYLMQACLFFCFSFFFNC